MPAGAYLHIEPGTIVELASSDSQHPTWHVTISVYGTLEVAGTAAAPRN